MALIGIEGFEGFNGPTAGGDNAIVQAGNVMDSGSSVQGANPSTTTRWGYGRSINGNSGGAFDYRLAIANRTKVFQGVAKRWIQNGPTAVFEVFDGATLQCWLAVDGTNRRINIYRGSGTTNLIVSSANNSIPISATWFYLEWCPVIDPSAGTIEVRIDGASVIIDPTTNGAGLNTRASANSRITSARLRNTGINEFLDDYYCFDDQGSVNNNFNGDSRVYTSFADTDNSVQFTPNTGSVNADNVDDLADIDDDTTYNSSANPGDKDSFNIEQIPASAIVQGIEVRFVARKDDATTRTARSFLERAGNTANGTTRTLATSYTLWTERYEVDPTDSSALTPAKINAFHLGYEMVS